MDTTRRPDRCASIADEPETRRGPVPLDPALLAWVVGGSSHEQAPHGRWSVPTTSDAGTDGPDTAPHGRW